MSDFLSKISLMQKGLDVSWKRNEIIGNNIANAETPNFKSSKLEFENILKSELDGTGQLSVKTTNPKHIKIGGNSISDIQPTVRVDNTLSMRSDGNNVDVENEMTELAKNNILYQTLVQKLSKEVSRIKYAINDGKR